MITREPMSDLKIIPKHSFNAHEWMKTASKNEIRNLVLRYASEGFGLPRTRANIEHFLELYHWLYPASLWQEHHVRAISTIIGEEFGITCTENKDTGGEIVECTQ